jgi:hypothetical protein
MALGAGLTLVCTLAARLPSWRVDLGRLQALMAVAFAFQALALAAIGRWRGLPHTGLAVFVVALAMRAAVLPVAPTLSDDVYRYIWDGRVLAHGIDPWAYAPSHPALAALRDAAIHSRINHPELRTIYPPLAEAGFALVAAVRPTVGAMKLWIALHDLALVAVLTAWCARRTGSALPAIAYAWNPLVVLEYAGSGHHDSTGLLWLALAFALADRRPAASAAAFAAAVLVKLAPLVLLPFLWRDWGARARAVAVALIAPGLALFLARARGAGSGLEAFATTWRNNELAFHYAALALGDRGARIAVAVAVAALVAVLLWRRVETVRAARATMRTLLLAGPVLHPWYLGWALVFEPAGFSWAWLALSALALLNYGVLAAPAEGGAYHLPLAGRAIEYGVPAAIAAVLALASRRRSRGGAEHA